MSLQRRSPSGRCLTPSPHPTLSFQELRQGWRNGEGSQKSGSAWESEDDKRTPGFAPSNGGGAYSSSAAILGMPCSVDRSIWPRSLAFDRAFRIQSDELSVLPPTSRILREAIEARAPWAPPFVQCPHTYARARKPPALPARNYHRIRSPVV